MTEMCQTKIAKKFIISAGRESALFPAKSASLLDRQMPLEPALACPPRRERSRTGGTNPRESAKSVGASFRLHSYLARTEP
jgi:hypothetical protein